MITGENRNAIVARWRKRADALDEDARRMRAAGQVHGPEGAADAEQAATEYRLAADDLEQAS